MALSRQINLQDPDTWTDEDVVYLRQRVDTVPPAHRHLLAEIALSVLPPAPEAESPELARLRAFLERNYPDEMMAVEQGDTPVGVAIRLLTTDDTTDPDEAEADDYDDRSVAELRKEVDERRSNPNADFPADVSKTRKPELIAMLRKYDADFPE